MKCAARNGTRADFRNCTMKIPVSLNRKHKFVDPFTWIMQDFPTIIPRSTMMLVRLKIVGKWYCVTPKIQSFIVPTRIGSNLNRIVDCDLAGVCSP